MTVVLRVTRCHYLSISAPMANLIYLFICDKAEVLMDLAVELNIFTYNHSAESRDRCLLKREK